MDGVSLLCALNATKNVSGLLVLAGAVATIFDINPFMYNARNNARCTQARKATHGLGDNIKTWTGLPARGRVNQSDRGQK